MLSRKFEVESESVKKMRWVWRHKVMDIWVSRSRNSMSGISRCTEYEIFVNRRVLGVDVSHGELGANPVHYFEFHQLRC